MDVRLIFLLIFNFMSTILGVQHQVVVGIRSHSVSFECKPDPILMHRGVRIKNIEVPLYESETEEGPERWPAGRGKYDVTRSGTTFIFTIVRTTFVDASVYHCEYKESGVENDRITQCNVVISAAPRLRLIGNHVAGISQTLSCFANLTMPNTEDFNCKQQNNKCPFLRIIHKKKLYDHTSYKPPEPPDVMYKMLTNLEYVPISEDNGTEATCSILSYSGTIIARVTKPMVIKYAVSKPEISPNQTMFKPGDKLHCEARGNPLPLIIWRRNDTGHDIKCKELHVTANMTGRNTWSCIAENEPEFEVIIEKSLITFDVEGENCLNKESEPYKTSAIVAWICVACFFLIIVLLALQLRMKRCNRRLSYDDTPKDLHIYLGD